MTFFGPSPRSPQPPRLESGSRPDIPLLRAEDESSDLDIIRTWQEAVSDALLEVVPHDLFALWLYPPSGQAVLVAPEGLAEDNLVIPLPNPHVDPDQLAILEDIVRDAGYQSAVCLGIPHGAADVGLMLIADLRPDRYGELEVAAARGAAHVMGPVLGRIVRRWPAASGERPADMVAEPRASRPHDLQLLENAERRATMFGHLGEACSGAGTPRDFLLAVSYACQPLLPHDYIELLAPDASGEQHYRLGLHGAGPLWSDPSLVVPSAVLDPRRLFGEASLLLIDDTSADRGGRATVPGGPWSEGEEPRSVIGVRLRILERTVGFLLLGNLGQDFYQNADVDLLDQVGTLIAARVDSFVLWWHQHVLRSNLSVLRHIPMHLSKISEALATMPLLGDGTRLFAQQAANLLPVEKVEFALRLGDENRVAIVEPGDGTPLADHAQVPVAGTTARRVINGELTHLLTDEASAAGPLSVLVVPIRVAGRVFGAVAMTAVGSEAFTRTDMAVAQQLADLIAPHFEIQRRTALGPAHFVPGWKRAPKV
jgi:GAF domain-containing protein